MNGDDPVLLWNQANVKVLDIRHTVMRFGEALRSYRLPASGFLYTTCGGARVWLDGTEYTAERFYALHGGKGMCLDIKPLEEPFEYYLILYKAALPLPHRRDAQPPLHRRDAQPLSERGNPFYAQYGFVPVYPLALYDQVKRMELHWRKPAALEKLHVRGMLYQFAYEWIRQLQMQDVSAVKPDIVSQVLRYIDERYKDALTLDSLAQLFNYSAKNLSRVFKKRTGYSLIDYMIRLRMDKAKAMLLDTGAGIQEIAEEVGYADRMYFNRIFKKHVGISPGRFREMGQRQADRPYALRGLSIVPGEALRYTRNENHYQYNGEGERSMYSLARNLTLSLTLCVVLLLTACGSAANPNASPSAQAGALSATPSAPAAETSTPAERTATDDFGHEIVYSANPGRILAPYMEDALVTLDVAPVAKYAAGGTVQKHLEPWLKDLPVIDLTAGISPEAVLGFDPDLIVISSHFLPVDKYETIAKIAPVYLMDSGAGDWKDRLNVIADLIGKSELAKQKMAEYDAKLAEAKEKLKQAAGDRTIAIIWPAEKEVYLVGSEFLSGQVLYGELGLKPHPLASGTPNDFARLSLEKLPDVDADELFVITPEGQTDEQVRKLLDALPLWSRLPAVQNGRVHQVESGHWVNSAYMANLSVIDDVEKALLTP